MKIPMFVAKAADILEKAGFEAYAVGGCVRDSLMGITPGDWDMCTNALPEQMCKAFSGMPVIGTGIKHGTVTVIVDNVPVEITTFRKDGIYLDSRRPDNVEFISGIEEDLSRRDLTINAMAYSERTGLIDVFGGKNDIENKTLRCVGEPEKRLGEDPLRILRTLRFASRLGFEIHPETAAALRKLAGSLKNISAERIREELLKLLCGSDVCKVLEDYREVFAVFIPELAAEFDFQQCNPHHCFDVYRHTVKAVGNIQPRADLRFIMLLHDIGKPKVFTKDENGVGHFKLHPTEGSKIADEIMRRLKFDNKTRAYVKLQILEHDDRFPPVRKSVRRFISKYGYKFFFDHLEVRKADALAQSDYMREEKLWELEEKYRIGKELMDSEAALTLDKLAIGGRDLLDAGFPRGSILNEVLNACLEQVVDEKLPNERSALLEFAKSML